MVESPFSLDVNNVGAVIENAAVATPNDTDKLATTQSGVIKYITWTSVKAFLKAYFDTLYSAGSSAIPLSKSWDIGGGFITTGNTRFLIATKTCTITGWNIVATGTSPTCTIDIWKVATGTTLPVVGNSIMGTKPDLATGNAVRSTTMTGWTTLAITAGDILAFDIFAVSNALTLTFTLEVA